MKSYKPVPDWVMDKLQWELDGSAVVPYRGAYRITVDNFDASFGDDYEEWVAEIDADTWDYWDNEKDPTKQRDPITLDEFNIYMV